MTLRKLIANTIEDSNQSWTIQWTTFIAGWWKFSRKRTPARSANILTRCLYASTKSRRELFLRRHSSWKLCVSIAAALLCLTIVPSASAQTKHKKSKKPKSTPCRAGCKPDTSTPDVATSSADDATWQRQLSELARNLQ